MPGEQTAIVFDSASVRVFWGRLPVLIRRPYSVESGPGPWGLLEAVKHARAYLRARRPVRPSRKVNEEANVL
jgi:hypothetical protein